MAALLPLSPYRASVHYRARGAPQNLSVTVNPAALGQPATANDDAAALGVELAQDFGGSVVRLRVTALDDIELDSIVVFSCDDRAVREDVAVFQNGWQSWSGSSAFGARGLQPAARRLLFVHEIAHSPSDPMVRGPGRFWSDLCVAIAAPRDDQAVVLGYLGGADTGAFEVWCQSTGIRIVARVGLDGATLPQGTSRDASPLLFLRGPDATTLLEHYAATLGRLMHARIPSQSTRGWCSWYRYFTDIDEEKIRANADALARDRDALPVDLVQVDDGYQAAIGDWLNPNERFPRGMGAVATDIRERGFCAGLWLAPFIARPGSDLLRDHPEWFLQDEAGRPRRALYNHVWSLLDTAKALDLTHPEVQQWLREVFATVANEWGYRFLKLDFLFAASLPGRRHDPTKTGAEVLRRGLEIIREAVGNDVHLLGCGCPLGPAVGIVDSMRIGPDVAPEWSSWLARFTTRDYGVVPSTRAATRNALARAFMHGRLWHNDPDCMLVRDRDTRLTLDEVRTLATVVALAGCTALVSDDVAALPEDRRTIASRAMEIQRELQGGTPRCLDLMRSSLPCLLWAPRPEGGAYLAIFNLADAPRDVAVDLASHGSLAAWRGAVVREVWSGEEYRLDARLVVSRLPAHGVRLFVR